MYYGFLKSWRQANSQEALLAKRILRIASSENVENGNLSFPCRHLLSPSCVCLASFIETDQKSNGRLPFDWHASLLHSRCSLCRHATLLRYVLSVTFCWSAVLKVMDQKTLVKRRLSYKVRITVYNKHLESLPDTSSQIFDWKQFARHSFSLFGGIRLSRQTSKTSKSTASWSPAERWNDGR